MDPITQSLFGAVIGQAGFARRLGGRAVLGGALIAASPDLDIFFPYDSPLAAWVGHRGITHSLIAGPLFGAALGWLAWLYFRWRKKPNPLTPWLWLGIIAFTTHAGLDLFTSYGTQLLSPFSATRFALPALPVIDFGYTFILAAGLLLGLFWRQKAGSIAGLAILFSVLWQVYGWDINVRARVQAEQDLHKQNAGLARVEAWPLIFQPWARRVAAETQDQFYVGLWSPLTGEPIRWTSYQKQSHPLIADFAAGEMFQLFHRFTSGHIFWRVHILPDGQIRLEAHDMRYINDSAPSLASLWGVAGIYSAQGAMQGEAFLFFNRPTDRAAIFSSVRRAAFGN